MSNRGTRKRILQAAFELITERSDPTVSMARIAERAGVSRQAVYLHFESRSALLLELVRKVDEWKGLGERMAAAMERTRDPVARAEAAVRVSAEYEAEIRNAALALDLARHTDAAAAAAWEDRMSGRRRHWTRVFRAIAEVGRLSSEWTPERAGEAFWAMTSPAVYRQLVDECGWTREAYAEWSVASLRRLFIRGEPEPGHG